MSREVPDERLRLFAGSAQTLFKRRQGISHDNTKLLAEDSADYMGMRRAACRSGPGRLSLLPLLILPGFRTVAGGTASNLEDVSLGIDVPLECLSRRSHANGLPIAYQTHRPAHR